MYLRFMSKETKFTFIRHCSLHSLSLGSWIVLHTSPWHHQKRGMQLQPRPPLQEDELLPECLRERSRRRHRQRRRQRHRQSRRGRQRQRQRSRLHRLRRRPYRQQRIRCQRPNIRGGLMQDIILKKKIHRTTIIWRRPGLRSTQQRKRCG